MEKKKDERVVALGETWEAVWDIEAEDRLFRYYDALAPWGDMDEYWAVWLDAGPDVQSFLDEATREREHRMAGQSTGNSRVDKRK